MLRWAHTENTDLNSPSGQTGDAPNSLRASVVLPTYNRSAALERVLLALGRQTVPGASYEVIVVADGCTDDTALRCQRLVPQVPYRLRLIEQKNAGPAVARNHGVHEAAADLILFIDDDVVPAAEWIAVHLAAHGPIDEDMNVVCGPLLPPSDFRLNAWGDWEEHVLCQQYRALEAGLWRATSRQFYTGNASLAKRHIVEVGGFDAVFSRAEDIELGLRLRRRGCVFTFLPGARTSHYVHRSFASWARMPVAYGRAVVSMSTVSDPISLEDAITGYHTRNILTRICTRLCLWSPARLALLTAALHSMAVASWWCRLSFASRAACSIAYNVRFYFGLTDALPDAASFRKLLQAARLERLSGGRQQHVRTQVIEILARENATPTQSPDRIEVAARG